MCALAAANGSAMTDSNTICLLGCGLLGTAMASRWLAAGWQVRGYDLNEQRRGELANLGGRPVAALSELIEAESPSPLVMCLPDARVVRQCFDAISPHLLTGQLLIDTTTVGPEDAIHMSQRCQTRGLHWVEANVAGSSQQMAQGEALLLLAGDDAAVQLAQLILAPLGPHQFTVGASGNAARMKLVVNLAIGLHRAVLAEALTLASSLQLNLSSTLEVLRACPSYSRAMDVKGQKMLERDFTPQARVAQHLKDVRLMLAAAELDGQPLPFSELHAKLLQSLVDRGLGELDNSAILLAYDRE